MVLLSRFLLAGGLPVEGLLYFDFSLLFSLRYCFYIRFYWSYSNL